MRLSIPAIISWLVVPAIVLAENPPPLTSLTSTTGFHKAVKPYVVLRRGPIESVIVNNEPVDDAVLPKHTGGYSGVALLRHNKQPRNIFVPSYSGLNFEHIHDGTTQSKDILFEPRRAPVELRVIDEHTVDLYQAATPHWGLESAHRYRLLEDGTIELAFECIPRKAAFKNNYIGLFWASYIHQPQSLDIHFRGHEEGRPSAANWIRGVTPGHGVLSTHIATTDQREFSHDAYFPLTLVFNRSKYRFSQPWYFGVCRDFAFAQMFRPQDQVRISQSPSGGGGMPPNSNPAWDFQFLIPQATMNQRYQFVMRAMYVPFESAEQVELATSPHRKALGHN